MSKLLFLSRVALLCNICFLFTFLMGYIPALENGIVTSTIIIMGNIISIVVNILIHLIYLILLFVGRSILSVIPAWLMIINFLFLLVQIILLIK